MSLTKDLLDILQQLLNKTNPPIVTGSGNVPHQGNQNPLALHTQNLPSEWIVDYGASYYMTGDGSLFSSFSFYKGNFFVHITYGTLAKVTRIGSMKLNSLPTLVFFKMWDRGR